MAIFHHGLFLDESCRAHLESFHSGFGGFALFGGNGAECHECSAVDGTSIVEEGANNLLDAFLGASVMEEGSGVDGVGELDFYAELRFVMPVRLSCERAGVGWLNLCKAAAA
jgi:hypothetical protein